MKKSKVIIPAMALLLFSTAASITGTVAWFTSTRVFNTEVANFSVVEAEGNLQCTMAAGIGTTYDSATNSVSVQKASASPAANAAVLTHGSVSIDTATYGESPASKYGHAFVVNQDTGNTFFDRGTEKGTGTNGWLYRSGATIKNKSNADTVVDIYIAVSWTMTFTYNFGAETAPVAVYLDTKESEMTDVATPDTGYDFTTNPSGKNDTEEGFRIGFYNAVNAGTTNAATDSHDVVWGKNLPIEAANVPDDWAKNHASGYATNDRVLKDGIIYKAVDDSAEGADWTPANWEPTGEISLAASKGCDAKFVSNTGGTTNYTASNYVYYKDQARVESGAEDSTFTAGTDRAERICVLTSTAPSVTITCAAWFEGTDPNVVSGNAMSCLSANMTFYSRSLSA